MLQKIGVEKAKEAPRQEVKERVKQLLEAGDQELRSLAAERLGALGAFEAIPALRRAYFDDATSRVRRSAALALAMLGDVGMTETFARALLTGSDDAAKTAAAALGILGDLRGLAALLESYVRGVRAQLIAEALNGFGTTAVEPILDLVTARPALAKRQALQGVLSLVPATRLEPMITRRIEQARPADGFAEQAKALLWIVELHKTVRMSIARQLLDSTADDTRKGVKTLRRIAEQVVS